MNLNCPCQFICNAYNKHGLYVMKRNARKEEKMLEEINSPQDLKKLTLQQKKKLAEEIRNYIIEIVSKNGGHLASNLGELLS